MKSVISGGSNSLIALSGRILTGNSCVLDYMVILLFDVFLGCKHEF